MGAFFDSLVDLSVAGLIKAGAVSSDDFELYRFSVEVVLLKLIHFISYFVIGLMVGKVMEGIIIILIFYGFRRNVGGYHAKTRMGCYIFSCLTILGSLYLTDIDFNPSLQIIIALCALIGLIILPPVHNDNRTVSPDEENYFRRRLRIYTMIYVLAYAALAALSIWKYVWICTIGLLLAFSLAVLGKVQNIRDKKNYEYNM